jgi:septum formation protein
VDIQETVSKFPLILASQSPRRKELLQKAGYCFEVIPPREEAEDKVHGTENPKELVTRLSYQKAADVALRVETGMILACDTLVEAEGKVIGKPRDREDARLILSLLRGKKHWVHSGLCLWNRPQDRRWQAVDTTELEMDRLSDQQIEEYLESELWRGKAGAFGYQDRLGWVQVNRGSESNVVGLPMERLEKLFSEAVSPPGP